ncbi:FAD-dependent oxidoreductase, partial [Hydrogenophaga aromaticivorans]|uniref:FAD-dependent oxidoreductase n=1 Tax=Hydrogenophaga aromaticivorans TaxID=2610898 RepID=UPI001FFCD713
MAAAVAAADAGADVTVFEATRTLGGRARALHVQRPDGQPLALDNGQHILIGAYSQTLALMQRVGVDLDQALLRLPLALPYPDGSGLQTPAWAARWPAPFDALAAIASARGWS